NSSKILLGTDGGIYASFSKGSSWVFLDKMAAGEFYRITLDGSTPYRIAGGLQDNENWIAPELTRSKEGILNTDWRPLGGGDGFYCAFDPTDSNVIYAESQEGEVHRINLRNGELKGLRPEAPEGQPAFRFHWNTPLIASVHDTGDLFLAGNRIFKLTKHGEEWQAISPDLSTLDPHKILAAGSGAENYGVVYALAESPVKKGLLWAGTDDGKLWLTSDEGEHWSDLTERLPAVLKGQWLGRIEPGTVDPDVAYLAVAAYRTGNYAPLLYRTSDRGHTWKSIAGNLPADGPVKSIREAEPGVLFAGTEFGLFLSIDGGDHWSKFGELPTVAVDDIQVQQREKDLVVATHGRSIYVIDDISPLLEFTAAVMDSAMHLFPPRPAEGFYPLPGWNGSAGSAVFRGANPPEGAILNYYVREFTGDGVHVSVADSSGRPVANLNGPGTPGFNRLTWDLRPTADLLNTYGGEGRKFVHTGVYTVTATYGKHKEVQKLTVRIDPGIETRLSGHEARRADRPGNRDPLVGGDAGDQVLPVDDRVFPEPDRPEDACEHVAGDGRLLLPRNGGDHGAPGEPADDKLLVLLHVDREEADELVHQRLYRLHLVGGGVLTEPVHVGVADLAGVHVPGEIHRDLPGLPVGEQCAEYVLLRPGGGILRIMRHTVDLEHQLLADGRARQRHRVLGAVPGVLDRYGERLARGGLPDGFLGGGNCGNEEQRKEKAIHGFTGSV
ncbi:MAG TPA: hypothetical protein VML00_13590, partial [Bacteroidota bacterium]|nr:hypothetical protein [Bacteroidota bacterium]